MFTFYVEEKLKFKSGITLLFTFIQGVDISLDILNSVILVIIKRNFLTILLLSQQFKSTLKNFNT